MLKHEIHLKVIPLAAANTRVVETIDPPENVFFTGDGRTDFYCGRCHALLADSIDEGCLKSMLLKCNKCQSLNEVPVKKVHRTKQPGITS